METSPKVILLKDYFDPKARRPVSSRPEKIIWWKKNLFVQTRSTFEIYYPSGKHIKTIKHSIGPYIIDFRVLENRDYLILTKNSDFSVILVNQHGETVQKTEFQDVVDGRIREDNKIILVFKTGETNIFDLFTDEMVSLYSTDLIYRRVLPIGNHILFEFEQGFYLTLGKIDFPFTFSEWATDQKKIALLSNDQILIVDILGTVHKNLKISIEGPKGIAIDESGTIAVINNEKVFIFSK